MQVYNDYNQINQYNFVDPQSKVAEGYLTLIKPYSDVELPSFNLKGSAAHLYPTNDVIKTLKKISNEHGQTKISHLNSCFISKQLSITKDTTLYYPNSHLEKLSSTIKDNVIFRNGSPLRDNHYIFVIDNKNRFIIDRKHTTVYGRIQHSSLSQGAPVKAAGTLKISTVNNIRKLCFENLSGHYQPTPESLGKVNELFNNTCFKLTSDTMRLETNRVVRTIEFSEEILLINELSLEQLQELKDEEFADSQPVL